MKLFKNIWELITETYNRLWEFNIGLHGAALAFYAIFSTAPLIIIVIWMLSTLLGQPGHNELVQTLQSILGSELTDSIVRLVRSTRPSASGLWSSLIAIGTLLFGATTLLSQLKQTLNAIWGVEDSAMGTIWHFLWDRLIGLLFIGILSLLFLGGLIAESVLYGLEHAFIPIFGAHNLLLIQLGSSLINLVLAIIFFTAMFKILPDCRLKLRDVAVGAVVTTLLVLVGKALVDWYLGSSALQLPYKAAGSFVVFLIWIYYNMQVMLIGALFTQVYTKRYGDV